MSAQRADLPAALLDLAVKTLELVGMGPLVALGMDLLDAELRRNGLPPDPRVASLANACRATSARRPSFANETNVDAPSFDASRCHHDYIDANEAAHRLGCSPQYARQLARGGRIRAERVGDRTWSFDATDVGRLADERRRAG